MPASRESGKIAFSGEKTEILLSICILSFNQSPEVERLLNSLSPQMTDDIEVVIRDDSTNNETELLVQRFSEIIPIRYFHGKKEGIDKTVIFLTEEARGKFVWWLGDDDVVPGGVGQVLDAIRNNRDLTFVWANYRLAGAKDLAIDLQSNCFFSSRDEVLELGGAALGFVSATVFKRELALPGIDRARKYIGSAFVNLYLVLYVISQPGRHYYVHGPVVICHPATIDEIKAVVVKSPGVVRNDAFEVFGVNFSRIVREFAMVFSSVAVRRTIKKSFGQTWRGMLVAWVGGWDTPKGKRVRMFKYFWTFPECWIALILFVTPLSVNKLLYRIYKASRTNRRSKSVG